MDDLLDEALRVISECHFHLGNDVPRILAAARRIRRLEEHGSLAARSSAHAVFSLMLHHRRLHGVGDRYMQWALAELRGLPDSPEICEARFMLGHIHGNRDRYALAVEQFRQAHEMAVRIRVPRIVSRAAVGAGLAEFRSGRPAEAERSLELARALAADHDDIQTSFEAFIMLAHIALERGDVDRVRDLLARCEPLLARSQDPTTRIDHLAIGMRCDWLEGRTAPAIEGLERVLAECREAARSRFEVSTYVAIAEVAIALVQHDPERYTGLGSAAVAELGRCLARWPTRRPLWLWYRARLARSLDRNVEARRFFEKGLRMARRLGHDHVHRLCASQADRFLPEEIR